MSKTCSCGTAAEVAALRAEVAKLRQVGVTKARGIVLPEGSWVVLPNGTAAQVGPDGVSYREESVHNVNDGGDLTKAVGRALAGAGSVPQTGKWKHYGAPLPQARGGS